MSAMMLRRRNVRILACAASVVVLGLIPGGPAASAAGQPQSFCWGGGAAANVGPGFELDAPNGYNVKYQGDNNLVVYYQGHAIWASNTASSKPRRLSFAANGHIFLTEASLTQVTHRVAAINDYYYPGAPFPALHYVLAMQSDGNLVEYVAIPTCTAIIRPVWATGTQGAT